MKVHETIVKVVKFTYLVKIELLTLFAKRYKTLNPKKMLTDNFNSRIFV